MNNKLNNYSSLEHEEEHSHHHHHHHHDGDCCGEEPYVNSTKVGRNDLCPCGSGKKYKKCCIE